MSAHGDTAELNKAGRKHGGKRGAKPKPAAAALLVSVQEGAAIFGVPGSTLRDLALRCELPIVRLGRRIWFRRADVEALIERNTVLNGR